MKTRLQTSCTHGNRPQTTLKYRLCGLAFIWRVRARITISQNRELAQRLARLVAEHRLDEDEAHELAADLAWRLAQRAYRL